MTRNTTLAQNEHQRSHGTRQSHADLALNTSLANSQGYGGLMQNSAYQSSPAHPHSAFDQMTMDSPYLDQSMNMQMDYNIQQNFGGNANDDGSHVHMYNQARFSQPMINPSMPQSSSQHTQHLSQGALQEPRSGSRRNSQHGIVTNTSGGSSRHPSRSQSLQIPRMSSPEHSPGATPANQPAFASPQDQTQAHASFLGPAHNPQPGSEQDRGMDTAAQSFDGVNGPVPVNVANYNPNNQGFKWETPEGGWPSTMVGRPHMQSSSYKHAYSSTGFDMLGVLVRLL